MNLTRKDRLTYALGGISDGANFTFVNNYLLFFLTGFAGIRPAAAGSITGVATIISALWGPAVGFLSDHARTRLGKRRLFLLIAMIPYFLAVVLCFTVIRGSEGFRAAYYSMLVIVFWSSFSTFYSPWLALGAAYTNDYNERLKLRQSTYMITQIGVIFGGSMPPVIVRFLSTAGLSEERSWQLMAVFIGFAGFFALLTVFLSSKGKDPSTENCPRVPFSPLGVLRDYVQLLSLKPMMFVALASFCFISAQVIFNADRVYYMNYNLNADASVQSLIILLSSALCAAMSAPITRFCQKTDKNKTIALCCTISAAGFLLVFIFAGTTLASMVIGTCCFSVCSSSFWQVTPSMSYDICDYDEYKNHVRREGAVTSMQNSLEMLCSGFASIVLGWILQLTGFVEGAKQQSAAALGGIRISLFLIPALFMVGCAVMMSCYPLTRSEYEKIKK